MWLHIGGLQGCDLLVQRSLSFLKPRLYSFPLAMLKFMDQTFCVERIFRFEYETGIYAIKAQNVVHIFNSQVPYICNFALAAAKTR